MMEEKLKLETTLPKIKKRFRCPNCQNFYDDIGWLINHVSKVHGHLIPKEWTVRQYLFHKRNRTDQPSKCVVCKKFTPWDEERGKYKRLCGSTACKETEARKAKENMVRKYGKEHLLDDPDTQRKMLENRGISGVYTFKDKSTLKYVGSYEQDFLDFFDHESGLDPSEIQECAITFDYILDNKKHIYIPDFYMPNFNIIIEIKDGGDNPNNHPKIQNVDKVKEGLKDEAVVNTKQYNYIKITNKEYMPFMDMISALQDDSANTFKIQGVLTQIGE